MKFVFSVLVIFAWTWAAVVAAPLAQPLRRDLQTFATVVKRDSNIILERSAAFGDTDGLEARDLDLDKRGLGAAFRVLGQAVGKAIGKAISRTSSAANKAS